MNTNSKKKDWTGKKFNKLTFIRPPNESKRNYVVWEVLCDCGKTIYRPCTDINRGKVKSCGCIIPQRKKDYAGKRHHKLTFIKPTGEIKNNGAIWEALCDCGGTTTLIPCSETISCGCEIGIASRKRKRKYDPIYASARRVWTSSTYRHDCEFEIFLELSQQDCHYCGRSPHRTYNAVSSCRKIYKDGRQLQEGNFTYNGLDRVDSSLGHEIGNIVPCCYDCSKAKSTLTRDKFLELINLVYQHSFRLKA